VDTRFLFRTLPLATGLALGAIALAAAPASCGGSSDDNPTGSDGGLDAPVQPLDGPADDHATVDVVDAGPRPRLFDWIGIVATGQSLSVGVAGTPVISTVQPFDNIKLTDTSADPKYDGVGDQLSMVPLTAPLRPFVTPADGGPYPDDTYPNNIYGESPEVGMLNQVGQLWSTAPTDDHPYVMVPTSVGESGRSITAIRKGGTGRAYAATLYEARAIKQIASDTKLRFGYGAIVLTHGEADATSATYGADVQQLFNDYNADLKAITGQTSSIPLILTQQSTFPTDATSRSTSTLAAWRLGVDHPGDFFCAGPKYQYEYGPDHIHLTAAEYVRLGEKYGEVYWTTQVLGLPWTPVQPNKVARDGTSVLVYFDVLFPPLNFDPALPPPHQSAHLEWAKGNGFEIEDAAGPIEITDVTVASGTDVLIHLTRAPGANAVVRYAMVQDKDGATGGLPEGRHGLLRDSDPFVGLDSEQVDCNVTDGSAVITPVTANALRKRSIHDLVTGSGFPAGVVVTGRNGADGLTLSQPYDGPPGPVKLTFAHEQRNYLVQFEMPIP